MKLTINTQQRLLILAVAGVIAASEAYQIFRDGGVGVMSFVVYAAVTGLGIFALRTPGRAVASAPQLHKAERPAAAKVKPGTAGQGAGANQGDIALVEKHHAIVIRAGKLLYKGLLGRFSWGESPGGKDSSSHQIFLESCTILGYYLVCLSLSGPSTLATLHRIQDQLKLRATGSIMGMEGQCAPGSQEALSPACKALSAHNLSLIDSFSHLYLRTVENFHNDHPYPLNDLIGGILMLFEGQVPTEPDYWEGKYGDVVYAVLDEIAVLRRG